MYESCQSLSRLLPPKHGSVDHFLNSIVAHIILADAYYDNESLTLECFIIDRYKQYFRSAKHFISQVHLVSPSIIHLPFL